MLPVLPVLPGAPCGPGGPVPEHALKPSIISDATTRFELFMMIPSTNFIKNALLIGSNPPDLTSFRPQYSASADHATLTAGTDQQPPSWHHARGTWFQRITDRRDAT